MGVLTEPNSLISRIGDVVEANHLPSLALALACLTGIAAGVNAWAGLGQAGAIARAVARAVVQLLAVGAVIGLVFTTPALAPLYLGVMLAAAGYTSGRRMRAVPHAIPAAAVSIAAGAATAAATIFISRAVSFDARTAVPLIAQLTGGAMTATTLTGQRMMDDVGARWDEVEGWLAIGATPRQAVLDPSRRAASRALVPSLDQTRNVGLVVLPGAFVGLLLGGATPLEAGRIQLLVLAGLLVAGTVSAVTIAGLLRRPLGTTRISSSP